MADIKKSKAQIFMDAYQQKMLEADKNPRTKENPYSTAQDELTRIQAHEKFTELFSAFGDENGDKSFKDNAAAIQNAAKVGVAGYTRNDSTRLDEATNKFFEGIETAFAGQPGSAPTVATATPSQAPATPSAAKGPSLMNSIASFAKELGIKGAQANQPQPSQTTMSGDILEDSLKVLSEKMDGNIIKDVKTVVAGGTIPASPSTTSPPIELKDLKAIVERNDLENMGIAPVNSTTTVTPQPAQVAQASPAVSPEGLNVAQPTPAPAPAAPAAAAPTAATPAAPAAVPTQNRQAVEREIEKAQAGKPAEPSTPKDTAYKLPEGKTLSHVMVEKYGITDPKKIQEGYEALAKHNGIKDPNKVNAGQELKLPETLEGSKLKAGNEKPAASAPARQSHAPRGTNAASSGNDRAYNPETDGPLKNGGRMDANGGYYPPAHGASAGATIQRTGSHQQYAGQNVVTPNAVPYGQQPGVVYVPASPAPAHGGGYGGGGVTGMSPVEARLASNVIREFGRVATTAIRQNGMTDRAEIRAETYNNSRYRNYYNNVEVNTHGSSRHDHDPHRHGSGRGRIHHDPSNHHVRERYDVNGSFGRAHDHSQGRPGLDLGRTPDFNPNVRGGGNVLGNILGGLDKLGR